jgi:hypothetical protein
MTNRFTTNETEYKKFQATINKCYPNMPLGDDEAAAAYHNLGEFMSLLVKVNEREKIVPMDVVP